MEQHETRIKFIRDNYPDGSISEIVPYHSGQNCLVYLVDETYIFRFPRYASDYPAFLQEIELLDALRGRLPIPIPEPVFRKLDWDSGPPCMGYRKLNGTPFRRDFISGIPDAAVQRLTTQLADFLVTLHVPTTHALVSGVLPARDTAAEYKELYRNIQEKLFPHMGSDARKNTVALFDGFLNGREKMPFQPCLRHGDFGPTNILIDESHRNITGILDFGYAGLGDPAYDLAGVACYGDAFLKRVGVAYPGFEGLRDRVAFYQGTFALQEALFGLEHDDQVAFERGIVPFR